jgi:hypothetical protein
MFPTTEFIHFLNESLLSSGLWTYVARDPISKWAALKCNFGKKINQLDPHHLEAQYQM